MTSISNRLDSTKKAHHAGTLATSTIGRIEQILPAKMETTAETGCGKSTILFSNLSEEHFCFCLDDRNWGPDSSIQYFEDSDIAKKDVVTFILGPTQQTLPNFKNFKPLDAVLIDGPHGYPFPEIEYFYFYPHLKNGGFLIVDDVHIPTIGRMADFLQEDEMFELVELVGTTAVFRRTDAPTFDPFGDGWWKQKFNQRRTPADHDFHLADGRVSASFASRVGAVDPALPAQEPPRARRSFFGKLFK